MKENDSCGTAINASATRDNNKRPSLELKNDKKKFLEYLFSSSSSIDATTLGGFWPEYLCQSHFSKKSV